uniref:WRKY domain-containing protein n=1 Tax=Nelumbo nucifera TaxID=4432 RepID=A0A822Y230_NELNU|nr:TPA_asm: hypothetical protein HUJ06_027491 [Nelumbo nucifera]
MEVKDPERMVIAKPVASRPSCSSFRSFSELLAGAINASPPGAYTETVVAAIRPKTVRFKPVANHDPDGMISSQGEISGTAAYSSEKVSKPDCKSTVVYKPLAKFVSRRTASLLANLGNFGISHQQTLVQHGDKTKQPSQNHLTSNPNGKLPPELEKQIIEPSKMATQSLEECQRAVPATTSGDRPSYDGYNWRKYGQKQVKGSEYPRSYYKCTHPNCAVKKKVERSFDGQIAEVVYKGEHNHPKPQPPKGHSSGAQGKEFVSDGIGQDTSYHYTHNERTGGSEERVENQNQVGFPVHLTCPGKSITTCDPGNSGHETPDNSCGLSGGCEEGSKGMGAVDNELRCKRRKTESQSNEVGISRGSAQDPHVLVQNSTDSDILGDGFRWRKYGQKVVKGNPYPSYYRCTSLKCNARKYVERASDDPKAFITTYEGKHNHAMPITRNLNSAVSDLDLLPSTNKKP